MPRFVLLQGRLVALLRRRVQSGAYTERQLARMVGVSQPHLHNVLKGERHLSSETADHVLRCLHLSVLDLCEESELAKGMDRQAVAAPDPWPAASR